MNNTILVILLSLLVPLILVYLVHKRKINGAANKTLPGPPGLPLIGNLLGIASTGNLPVYLWRLSKKYGPIMQMKIGSVPMVIISSPKLAKEVMKTQDLAFCGRSSLLGQRKMSYECTDMVFSPYGEYWREVRKITAIHLFSLRKTQSFRPIREDEISRMMAKISSISEAGAAVDLSHMATALGSTLISRIAFGKRYDEDGPEMRRFENLLKEAQAVLSAFYVSDYFPSFGWVDKLTGSIRRLEQNFNDLDSFYQEMIDEHLDPTRLLEDQEEDDILDILIKLREDESCSIELDAAHIKPLLTNIFIAATDTSAAATIWTMTNLIKAPKVMQKVQSEIRNVVGMKKGKVDEDDLPKLPYLKAVISESFRLYPPAPLLVPRETNERCRVEGYELQARTAVYVNAWAVARDPDYWKDPEEFVPERFVNSNIEVKGQDFGVIPFGSGRRMCPGMPMGLLNVEVTLANLLYSFNWDLPRGVDIDFEALPGLTMHKKNPLVLLPLKHYHACV